MSQPPYNLVLRYSDLQKPHSVVKGSSEKFSATLLIDPSTKDGKIALKKAKAAALH